MHFCRGVAPSFPPIPLGMGNTKVPTEEKGGSSVLNPGLHKKAKPQGLSQTARSDGGTTRKTREIFPAAWADFPVMHRRIFAEGRPCSPPNPAGNGKHKSSHRRKKVGAVFYIPDYMKTQAPWTFPNCSERWWDNSEGAEDFSLDEGCLPCYAPAFFHRGATLFSPQSRMGWENKTPTSFAKGGSSVYKGRTNR